MGWWYIDAHSIGFCGTNALSYIFPWTKTVVSHVYIYIIYSSFCTMWDDSFWFEKTVGWFQESSKCLLSRMRHQSFRPWRRVMEAHRRLNQDFWWFDLPKKKCGDEMIQVVGRFVCWKKWKIVQPPTILIRFGSFWWRVMNEGATISGNGQQFG